MSFRFFKNTRCGIIEATEDEKQIDQFLKASDNYIEVENPLAAKKPPVKVIVEPEAPKPKATKKTTKRKKAAKK